MPVFHDKELSATCLPGWEWFVLVSGLSESVIKIYWNCHARASKRAGTPSEKHFNKNCDLKQVLTFSFNIVLVYFWYILKKKPLLIWKVNNWLASLPKSNYITCTISVIIRKIRFLSLFIWPKMTKLSWLFANQ